jgi:copper(I)-binding protein
VISVLSAALLVLSACGGDDSSGVEIDNAWARATVAGQERGAVYFDLTVENDDVLAAASVPTDVAAEAEVHEVVPADMGDMDSDMDSDDMGEDMDADDMDDMDDMDGEMGSDDMEMGDDMGDGEMAMTMREMVDGLSLTAGDTVVFEPGSYHIMLFGLADALEVGDEFDVTLEFAEAGDVTVTVPVLETAP